MAARDPLVLHIGQHTTGTTAIQDYLAGHPRKLASVGLHYAKAGRVGSQHAALPASYMTDHPHIPARFLGTDPALVASEITADRRKGCLSVLSSEVWWELLTVDPTAFDAAVALLSQSCDVTIVYFVRDPEEKVWSSLKHLARVGPPMDASAVLHKELVTDRTNLTHLETHYPSAQSYPADRQDAVARMLEVLGSLPTYSRTPRVRERLSHLIRDRRRSPVIQRVNAAPSLPAAPALTIATAQALWDARAFNVQRPASLEGLFARLFSEITDSPDLADLPGEEALRHAVFSHQSARVDTFLAAPQIAAVRRYWSDPRVSEVSAEMGTEDYRQSVVAALADTHSGQ